MPTTMLTKVWIETDCLPWQAHAWTDSGQYLYLHYRSGRGTVDAYDSPDWQTWTEPPTGRVAEFGDDSIDMDLERFCRLAGLRCGPDTAVR